MVKCESCGTDLSEGAKFCSNCGAPSAILIPWRHFKNCLKKPIECGMRSLLMSLQKKDFQHMTFL